jgi:hypothetical protein
MKKIVFFLPSENLVQILPESGSSLDPKLYLDPPSSKTLDPDPYPHITNADPEQCIEDQNTIVYNRILVDLYKFFGTRIWRAPNRVGSRILDLRSVTSHVGVIV